MLISTEYFKKIADLEKFLRSKMPKNVKNFEVLEKTKDYIKVQLTHKNNKKVDTYFKYSADTKRVYFCLLTTAYSNVILECNVYNFSQQLNVTSQYLISTSENKNNENLSMTVQLAKLANRVWSNYQKIRKLSNPETSKTNSFKACVQTLVSGHFEICEAYDELFRDVRFFVNLIEKHPHIYKDFKKTLVLLKVSEDFIKSRDFTIDVALDGPFPFSTINFKCTKSAAFSRFFSYNKSLLHNASCSVEKSSVAFKLFTMLNLLEREAFSSYPALSKFMSIGDKILAYAKVWDYKKTVAPNEEHNYLKYEMQDVDLPDFFDVDIDIDLFHVLEWPYFFILESYGVCNAYSGFKAHGFSFYLLYMVNKYCNTMNIYLTLDKAILKEFKLLCKKSSGIEEQLLQTAKTYLTEQLILTDV